LRRQLGNPARAKRFADLPKLLKAARVYYEETDFAREFLEGAVAQDDARMRRAVKLLCQEHREEILEANGSLEKLFGLN
jgi:cell division septum initiation protein DivIVA